MTAVASPIPLSAQPAGRGGRMLSELAPVMMTGMKFYLLLSTFTLDTSGFRALGRYVDCCGSH